MHDTEHFSSQANEAHSVETWPVVTVLSDYVASTGESPVWDEKQRALYWVDIDGCKVLRWSMQDGRTEHWQFDREVCSLGLASVSTAASELVLALRDGVFRFDTRTCNLTLIARPEAECVTQRLNDGKVGPDGAFWVGSMDERPDKQPVAALYRVGSDGACRRVGKPVKVSNGLGFSPDGAWVYHSDSRGGEVVRYPYEARAGTLGPAQAWIAMQPGWGRPDGAAVDRQGAYWSCGIDAGRINRFSPEGRLIDVIRLPVSHPTMCCFGGDDMQTLFVTSLVPQVGHDARKYPDAGRLLSFRTEVAGLPASRFGIPNPNPMLTV